MRFPRQLPPAAPPIPFQSLYSGFLGLFSGSRRIEELKEDLRDFFGVPHIFLLGSGKAAMYMILRALSRLSPEKDEVLVPAYTCFSVPSAIVSAGLKVAVCDTEEGSFDFSHDQLAKAIHDSTLCVVPTHLFGIPVDIDRTMEICRLNGLYCVEDAAQSMGGRIEERFLGTIGDVGFFSLGRGKNIMCGGGGIILSQNDEIADEIAREYRKLRSPPPSASLVEYIKTVFMAVLINPYLYWIPAKIPLLGLGETYFNPSFPIEKLSNMKAGWLKEWRRDLTVSVTVQAENTAYFMRKINGAVVRTQIPCNRFPVLAENRSRREFMLAKGKRMGLGISRMYPTTISEIPEIRKTLDGASFPVAKELAERIFTLPTHRYLTGKDKERIVDLIRSEGHNE